MRSTSIPSCQSVLSVLLPRQAMAPTSDGMATHFGSGPIDKRWSTVEIPHPVFKHEASLVGRREDSGNDGRNVLVRLREKQREIKKKESESEETDRWKD